MKNYLDIDAEKRLAHNIYYNGGTVKFRDGGMFSADGGDPSLFKGNYQGNDNATRDDMSTLRKGTSWKNEATAANVGTGLNVAGTAVEALDDDPDYGNADIAASTLKYASMGAVAGPWGAAAGAAVGLGVGLVQKNKFEKEEKKAEHKKKQEEGYSLAMESMSEFEGYADGGVINKYAGGGETDPPTKKKPKTSTSYLNADGSLKLNTTDPLAGAGGGSGSIAKDTGLWDEDASIYDNTRGLLSKGMNSVQYASLRPGGNNGRRNPVFTALSEMTAIPSINRIVKKNGDLEHIAHDPTGVGAWTHLGLNALAAVPGVSAVTKGTRATTRASVPFLKGAYTAASKYMKTHPSVDGAAKFLEGSAMLRQGLHATEKVLHTGHRIDENRKTVTGQYDLSNKDKGHYQTGGMTKGAYSHSTNPLKVVDKSGKDTGMELTGGEGVFDKPFMGKLKGMLASGNYQEAGKAVQTEMGTWKHK